MSGKYSNLYFGLFSFFSHIKNSWVCHCSAKLKKTECGIAQPSSCIAGDNVMGVVALYDLARRRQKTKDRRTRRVKHRVAPQLKIFPCFEKFWAWKFWSKNIWGWPLGEEGGSRVNRREEVKFSLTKIGKSQHRWILYFRTFIYNLMSNFDFRNLLNCIKFLLSY